MKLPRRKILHLAAGAAILYNLASRHRRAGTTLSGQASADARRLWTQRYCARYPCASPWSKTVGATWPIIHR